MRPLAIPALLLLALAGAALAPTGAAAPPSEPCNGTVGGSQTVGPVTVFVSPPCYEVSVRAMSCPIAGSWKEVRVQTVVVRAYTCDSPDGPDPASAGPAWQPPCTCPPPPQCREVTTTGPIAAFVSVTITHDCRIIVALLYPTVACTEPLDGTWVITQGRITVVAPCRPQFDPCEPPFECYPESASAGFIPPYCRRAEVEQGPVYADVGQCFAQVALDLCGDAEPDAAYRTEGPASELVDGQAKVCVPDLVLPAESSAVLIPPVCIEREANASVVKAGFDSCRQSHEDTACSSGSPQRIHYYRQVGPVYAQVHFCFPHSPPPDLSASASDPGPCGVQQRCPAPVGLCSGVNDQVAATPTSQPVPIEVHYTVSDHCQVDVYVKADVVHCLFGERYNEFASAGPVTVWVWGCAPPPTETSSASMADPFPTCVRECSPLPSSACEVRDATPGALVHPLWGYDCTLDVETSCLGGSDESKDAQVGFVNVSLAQCDGPDWS